MPLAEDYNMYEVYQVLDYHNAMQVGVKKEKRSEAQRRLDWLEIKKRVCNQSAMPGGEGPFPYERQLDLLESG